MINLEAHHEPGPLAPTINVGFSRCSELQVHSQKDQDVARIGRANFQLDAQEDGVGNLSCSVESAATRRFRAALGWPRFPVPPQPSRSTHIETWLMKVTHFLGPGCADFKHDKKKNS